ncbi:hypothetical protein, partial [Xylella taiwanensis]|uniref:hypothetical protein n=1 Tax=Xylella taiwanensis TaxID=1444770 RepID=UPI001F3D3EE7
HEATFCRGAFGGFVTSVVACVVPVNALGDDFIFWQQSYMPPVGVQCGYRFLISPQDPNDVFFHGSIWRAFYFDVY